MGPADVERYLERIGLSSPVESDLAGLTTLHHAHLAHVPFENLDIVYAGGVPHDRGAALEKITAPGRRGGWCFELNGPFAQLLAALGFDVLLLGAAVLHDGPTTVIEHLALEVSGGDGAIAPHLVDVGFGDSFDVPLELNTAGPQPGGHGTYEFIASPQGVTLAEDVEGTPVAIMRFKRVAHQFDDFAPIARSMQIDPSKHWATKPFATRLINTVGFDRVTLAHNRLTIRRGGHSTVEPVDDWFDALDEWFGIDVPADVRRLPD